MAACAAADDGAAQDPSTRSSSTPAIALDAGRTVAEDVRWTGCDVADPGTWDSVEHLEAEDAPSSDVLYDVPLPAAGPHFSTPLPLTAGLPDAAVDVRALVHNLEHGAVVVFVDPNRVDQRTVATLDAWQRQLAEAGFAEQSTRAGVIVSRVPDGATDVAPVSFRAWDVAIDCDGFDVAQADAVVATLFGTRGDAPEAMLGPYPDDNGVIEGGPVPLPRPTTTA